MKPIYKHYILLTSALVILLQVSKVEAQALTPYTNKAGFSIIVSTTCTPSVITQACLGTNNYVLANANNAKIHGRWPQTYVNGPGVDAYILTYFNITTYIVELELNDGSFTPPVTVVANKQHTTSSTINVRYYGCTNGSGTDINTDSYYADVEFDNFVIPVGKRVRGARVNLNPVVAELADFAKFIVTTNSITCTGANTTAPIIPVTTITASCPGNTFNLNSLVTSTTPSSFFLRWYTNATATGAAIANPTAVNVSGTYYAFYVDVDNKCFSPASVAVKGTANCPINLTNTCTSSSVDLASSLTSTTPSGYTVTYHSGTPATAENQLPSSIVTTSGTYYGAYFFTALNCFSPTGRPLQVTINNLFTVNAGEDVSITCTSNPSGATIGAAAVGAVTYLWSPATALSSDTAANPKANPTATTEYTLTATNTATGCNATDKVIVTVDKTAPATPSLTQTSIANVCPATSVDLNSLVTNTTNPKWYTDKSHASEVTTPTAVNTTGTYYPFYINTVNGCYSKLVSTGVTATITTVPDVPSLISPPIHPTCAVTTGTIAFTVQAGLYQYSIDNFATVTTTSPISGLAPGDYTLKVRSANNTSCANQSASPIKINAVPTKPSVPTLAATPIQPTCGTPTGTIVFTTQPNVTYSIDNGITYQNSETFSGLLPATYTLKVINPNDSSCIASGSTPILILAAPLPPAVPTISSMPKTNVCPAPTANLNIFVTSSSTSGTLLWYTNNTHTGTAVATPETSGAGTYYAFYNTTINCYSPASVPVTVTITDCCVTQNLN